MVIFFSRQRAFRATMTVSALAILSACSQGLDYDLRGIGGGLSTADAAAQATTAPPPTPDSRGIISYPTYQVAVAQNGDTINTVASRLGLDAPTLARFNGINENAPLRSGEIVALPTRVAEGSPQAGPVITGPIQSGGVDIGTLASGAIDRSGTTNTGGDVRVAALPPTQTAAQTGTEPVRHKVVRGETAYTISRLYQVPVASLAEWNGLGADFGIREGQYLLIPVAQQAPPATVSEDVPKPGTGSPTPLPPSAAKPLPPAQAPVITAAPEPEPEVDVGERTAASDVARMLFPVNGAIIREFSKGKNEGIDIKADPGTAVRAADEGTVAAITKSAEGIPIIVIRHEPELLTVYANVTDVGVEKGARVNRGDAIAKLRSGNDAFVHFEVRRGFDSVDPMPYLR
ncbi:MAG: M23 family metallopeptidase [Roseobacter sp.]